MESCNDSELLYLIRCGNEDAQTCLYQRYYNSIRRWIKPYTRSILSGDSPEDYLQSVMLFLPVALDSYRDDMNTSLRTFLNKVITRRLLTIIHKNKDSWLYEKSTLSLDEWTDDWEETRLEEIVADPLERDLPDKHMLVKETYAYYMGHMALVATELEKEVSSLKNEGYEAQEIAKMLHISIKSVYNSLYRYHRKLLAIDEFK